MYTNVINSQLQINGKIYMALVSNRNIIKSSSSEWSLYNTNTIVDISIYYTHILLEMCSICS